MGLTCPNKIQGAAPEATADHSTTEAGRVLLSKRDHEIELRTTDSVVIPEALMGLR